MQARRSISEHTVKALVYDYLAVKGEIPFLKQQGRTKLFFRQGN
jgi:hypothetical protein